MVQELSPLWGSHVNAHKNNQCLINRSGDFEGVISYERTPSCFVPPHAETRELVFCCSAFVNKPKPVTKFFSFRESFFFVSAFLTVCFIHSDVMKLAGISCQKVLTECTAALGDNTEEKRNKWKKKKGQAAVKQNDGKMQKGRIVGKSRSSRKNWMELYI